MSDIRFVHFLVIRVRSQQLLATVLWAIVVCLGCGRGNVSVVPVSGVVTLDGTPVDAAYVTFMPANGRPSVGRTDGDGRYALGFTGKSKGALIGMHRVTVTTKQDAMPDLGIEGAPERIPDWYNTKSQLEIEVTRDRKPYDLRLTTVKE
jgi:hypothetical protein